jgi:hypothetical protein
VVKFDLNIGAVLNSFSTAGKRKGHAPLRAARSRTDPRGSHETDKFLPLASGRLCDDWGHLTYRGYGFMLKVDSTSTTNYFETDPMTRVVEGTAITNLYGNRVFRVTATDNGEPGGNDTFQLELDNGYFTQGTLLSANVALLTGNLSSTPPPGFMCGAP